MSKTPSLRLALESLWNLLCCAWALADFFWFNFDRIIYLVAIFAPYYIVPQLAGTFETKGYMECHRDEKLTLCNWKL